MHIDQGYSSLSDAVLLKRYQDDGDLEVLGALYNRYMSMVFGVCCKYLKDREEARDATMQIFEKLISTLHGHAIANFKSWLYATSKNHCLMKIRSEKGRKYEEFDPAVVENSDIPHPDQGELEENLSAMERCIEKLVEEQQRCVRLFYLDQKCYREITALTGYELNSVKSYIQNGKRNLKICMDQHG